MLPPRQTRALTYEYLHCGRINKHIIEKCVVGIHGKFIVIEHKNERLQGIKTSENDEYRFSFEYVNSNIVKWYMSSNESKHISNDPRPRPVTTSTIKLTLHGSFVDHNFNHIIKGSW